MSNLKQIGLGIMQYTQDYDERYPPLTYGSSGVGSNAPQTDKSMPGYIFSNVNDNSNASNPSGRIQTWMDFIYPYVKNTQVFICPSFTAANYTSPPTPSYGYNEAIGGGWDSRGFSYRGGSPTRGRVPIAQADISRVSQVLMITDYAFPYINASPIYQVAYSRNTDAGVYARVAPHLGGGTVAFADGHVKWFTRQYFASFPYSGTASASSNRCDLDTAAGDTTHAFCSTLWNPFLP